MFHKQVLGRFGEDRAVTYLVKLGYRIITRNFKARYGEIDIITIHENTLVFIEVKARIGNRFGTPEESVTDRKLREVVKTAQYFKQLHPEFPDALRIDVIALDFSGDGGLIDLRHIQNVTG